MYFAAWMAHLRSRPGSIGAGRTSRTRTGVQTSLRVRGQFGGGRDSFHPRHPSEVPFATVGAPHADSSLPTPTEVARAASVSAIWSDAFRQCGPDGAKERRHQREVSHDRHIVRRMQAAIDRQVGVGPRKGDGPYAGEHRETQRDWFEGIWGFPARDLLKIDAPTLGASNPSHPKIMD